MKATKIGYWISTILISLMMTYSAVLYLAEPQIQLAFDHLGFPGYFRIELAIAKFIGVAVLVIPVTRWVREWAYAGLSIVFISAIVAHSTSGDPAAAIAMPAVFLLLNLTSYFTYKSLIGRKLTSGQQKNREVQRTAKTVVAA